MARPMLPRVLLPLLLAACLLFQVSECRRRPSSPAAHGDAPHHQLLDAEARAARPAAEAHDDGKTSADDNGMVALSAAAATATPALDKDGSVGASRTNGRAGLWLRPAVPLRSKLARRFLAAADVDAAGTDGAGPSCHSNNVHINCPPASKP